MASPNSPDSKLARVRRGYLSEIIPSVRLVYETSNKVRESFVLVHCALLGLSGFYAGSRDTSGHTYCKFVDDFFPAGYDSRKLWKDLRNSLVHAYTLTSTYVLSHKHPEMHLYVMRDVESERTGQLTDLVFLNFENFLDDLEMAARRYFKKAKTEPDLLNRLSARYDVAPPATYISDQEVVEKTRL